MKKVGHVLFSTVAIMLPLALLTAGCATKKFARAQANAVNARLSKVEAKTNQQIAYINNKVQTDMSQLNERISTTDLKVTEAMNAAQQANGSASEAKQMAQDNQAKITATSTEVTNLATGVANAMNYQLVAKGDVTFGFDKSNLTPATRAAVDALIQKLQGLPRSVVELVGYTDRVGSRQYNYALSRRRAEAVQRYLVANKVPLRSIHIVGLGKEAPPPELEAEAGGAANMTKSERNRLARRVQIRIYGAGDITQGTASREDEQPQP
jgi:outer membrane protein OmpA-like peptidoglycan-associated protein